MATEASSSALSSSVKLDCSTSTSTSSNNKLNDKATASSIGGGNGSMRGGIIEDKEESSEDSSSSDDESESVGTPSVPVFRPTWDEFKDFNQFVQKIEPELAEIGLCKVVPPPEFHPNEGTVAQQQLLSMLKVYSPIRQKFAGRAGIYEVSNIVALRSMSVSQFQALAEEIENTKSKHEVKSTTEDDYEALERAYWRNIGFKSPLYGADSPGTIFDSSCKNWNLNSLGSILDLVDIQIEGVTSTFLYFGQWKSSFAWHTEDVNLFSINYLHFGKSKQWYVVPPKYASQLEKVATYYFPENHRKCPEFLRHKTTIISPKVLEYHHIPVRKVIQHVGEFIITFPKAYHAGFNYGFNCAESVNFATERWVPFGLESNYCRCMPDTVHINMDAFIKQLERLKAGKRVKSISNITVKIPEGSVAQARKRMVSYSVDDTAMSDEISHQKKQLWQPQATGAAQSAGKMPRGNRKRRLLRTLYTPHVKVPRFLELCRARCVLEDMACMPLAIFVHLQSPDVLLSSSRCEQDESSASSTSPPASPSLPCKELSLQSPVISLKKSGGRTAAVTAPPTPTKKTEEQQQQGKEKPTVTVLISPTPSANEPLSKPTVGSQSNESSQFVPSSKTLPEQQKPINQTRAADELQSSPVKTRAMQRQAYPKRRSGKKSM